MSPPMKIARVSNHALLLTLTMLLDAEGFNPIPRPESFVDSWRPFEPVTIDART